MRTTLNLKEELVEAAAEATNIREKTKLVHAGLQALIERAARERTAARLSSRHFGPRIPAARQTT